MLATPAKKISVADLSRWTGDPAIRNAVDDALGERKITRRPCALDCCAERPCERCVETAEYLRRWYAEREPLLPLLSALRELARLCPRELRELLVDVIIDVTQEAKR